jgi:hypothetical protein
MHLRINHTQSPSNRSVDIGAYILLFGLFRVQVNTRKHYYLLSSLAIRQTTKKSNSIPLHLGRVTLPTSSILRRTVQPPSTINQSVVSCGVSVCLLTLARVTIDPFDLHLPLVCIVVNFHIVKCLTPRCHPHHHHHHPKARKVSPHS